LIHQNTSGFKSQHIDGTVNTIASSTSTHISDGSLSWSVNWEKLKGDIAHGLKFKRFKSSDCQWSLKCCQFSKPRSNNTGRI